MTSQHAIEQYAATLGADQYWVRLVNEATGQGIPVSYSAAQLTNPKTVGYLRWQNSLGFDVYARPVGCQYVLLDDLTGAALARMKADDLRPCLLLETSPANFQAWVILDNCPADREEARAICRAMAKTYGADLRSADPDHVGRLPGLTNRKPKHRQPDGQYPYVKLHRAMRRTSHFSTLSGGAVVNEPGQADAGISRSIRASGEGHSEHDYGIVCGLVAKGWPDDRITAHLLRHSPDIERRKGRYVMKYIERTIRHARTRLGIFGP